MKRPHTMNISIIRATCDHAQAIADMTGELLDEIMDAIGERAFDFAPEQAAARLRQFFAAGKYDAFIAVDGDSGVHAGFIGLYESCSLYAGEFGTIPELYVRPPFRSHRAGKALLDAARQFGCARGWTRLEVTTPPLPHFQRTLEFYEREGFSISGGRKLQSGLCK